MRATWVGIYDRGNLALERIHFRAAVDIDLQFFLLVDTELVQSSNLLAYLSPPTGPQVQAGNKSCFWFMAFKVKAGENVVLYTRAGNKSTETKTDGSIFHFFFRGLPAQIYSNAAKRAVLFELSAWQTTT